MFSCPKCGSMRISGPRYIKANDNYGTEALKYSCNQCGYSEQEPCRDATNPDRSISAQKKIHDYTTP